jgi:hypothetical protein
MIAAPPLALGDELRARGWRAGAVVLHSSVPDIQRYLRNPDLALAEISSDDWLVVVSQTRDVVAKKLDQEPFLEMLHCQRIPKLRRQYKELRSTRRLDFKPNKTAHPNVCLTAHATANRFLVPRNQVSNLNSDPDRRLDQTACRRVSGWYALRYDRPAWPETFIQRIDPVKEQLEAALEPLSDDIAQVRVAIRDGDRELADAEAYRLQVYFVMDARLWESDPGAREQVQRAFAAFVSLLRQCHGIEIDEVESEVVSGEDFSWQETQETELWDFANLTHRD